MLIVKYCHPKGVSRNLGSVYVANMQISLKLLIAFVHNDVKNAFSQSLQYICVHQHGDGNTDISGKLTEINGAASGQVCSHTPHIYHDDIHGERGVCTY